MERLMLWAINGSIIFPGKEPRHITKSLKSTIAMKNCHWEIRPEFSRERRLRSEVWRFAKQPTVTAEASVWCRF
jgi:hypothetical protein